jgi:hypothetical protein
MTDTVTQAARLKAADLLAQYADFIRHSVKADELEAHPYLPEIERVVDDLRAATTAWNTRDGGAATPMREAGTASSVGADVVEDCTACERLGVDCGEHVPSWEQLAIYWRTRALQAPSRAVPAEPSDEEVERAIDDGLVTRFRSALRFAASHSVISSADEHALLASLSTAQVDEPERLRKAAQALLDGLTSTYTARNGREVGIQGDDGEKCYIVHSDLVFDLRAALSAPDEGEGHE